jgi:patatin-like phospholipase/acyl hydrolase
MKKVLSIDGGGIRGIIPATVLTEIEHRTGKGIAEIFDLIAGTSTGGILALGLNVPGEDGRPLHGARSLKELYETKGIDIFRINLWRKVSTIGGLIDEEYTPRMLEGILEDYLGETGLESCITNTLVTSYDIERQKPFVFRSWEERYKHIGMKEAARATSAAPGFFEPSVLELDGVRHTLIDGGVFINNPALSAYLEAMRIFPGESEFLVVSLGTGEKTRKITYEEAKNWGKIDWALPVLDVIFDGMNDAVDYHLTQILGDNYFRFQNIFTDKNYDMNLAPRTEDEIRFIMEEAANFLLLKNDEIDRVCEALS